MYKRNGNTGDLKDVLFMPITIVVMSTLCLLLVTGLTAALDDPEATAEAHNATVAKFNALSLTERQAIFEFGPDLNLDEDFEISEETYLMETVEPGMTVGEFYASYWQLIVRIFVIGYSALTFFSYWKEKRSYYYLSDLPLSTIYGWVLFISMFVAWPFLALNWIHANLFSRLAAELREKRRERRERNRAEHQKVRELGAEPVEELTMEQRFSVSARKAYVQYVKHGAKQAQADRLQNATKQVEASRKRLDELGQDLQKAQCEFGEAIKSAQRELGKNKAELNKIQQAELTDTATTTRALSEWESLTKMRGVTSIKVTRSGKKTTGLSVLVKVRVPYQGEFYDFGDYTIWLSGSEYRCTRTRSGVKLNATSNAPNYNETRGFCFGDRKYLIGEYMQNGRFLEAIDLMIEALHSVNSSDAEAEIPNCFRKVKVIERAQRHHQLYQKLFKRRG